MKIKYCQCFERYYVPQKFNALRLSKNLIADLSCGIRFNLTLGKGVTITGYI